MRIVYLIAPVAVLGALVVDLGLWAEAPAGDAWRRAGDTVRAGWQAGDVAVVAPWWAEEGRTRLAGLSPRRLENPGEEEFAPARRVWVVSAFHDTTAEKLASRFGKAEVDQSSGGVRVTRFSVPNAGVTYDFVARVRDARVAVKTRGGEQPCRGWGGGAWRCGGNLFFGPMPREFDYSTYTCLWAQPPGGGGALTATYGEVPLASRLVVSGGIANFGRRNRPGGAGPVASPVLLQVAVGGQPVGNATFTNGESLKRVSFDTSRFKGQTLPVTFVVSAITDEMRQFCMIPIAREQARE